MEHKITQSTTFNSKMKTKLLSENKFWSMHDSEVNRQTKQDHWENGELNPHSSDTFVHWLLIWNNYSSNRTTGGLRNVRIPPSGPQIFLADAFAEKWMTCKQAAWRIRWRHASTLLHPSTANSIGPLLAWLAAFLGSVFNRMSHADAFRCVCYKRVLCKVPVSLSSTANPQADKTMNHVETKRWTRFVNPVCSSMPLANHPLVNLKCIRTW